MNKRTIILIIISVVIISASATVYALTRPKSSTNMPGMNHGSMSSTPTETTQPTTSAIYEQYLALKGENYDRAFLANMMAHHQGAVDMANLAATRAQHQEIKTLAHNIIQAQTSEIAQMKAWQTEWGYSSSTADTMADHSSMGTMNDMSTMTSDLKNLSGDEFDKKFIEHMIQHHQSAIDMATPGKANASHQELKDLTVAIVSAQTKEVQQMEQWQKDWGY